MSGTNPFFLFSLIVVWLSTSLNRIIGHFSTCYPFSRKRELSSCPSTEKELPKVAELQSRNRSHALHALEFLYQSFQTVSIVNLNREVAREKAIIGIDRNASQKQFLLL